MRSLKTSDMAISTKTLKRILANYYVFESLIQQGCTDTLSLPGGEEVCFWDLLRGFEQLPQKQKEAVFFHVLLDLDADTVSQITGGNSERADAAVRMNAQRGLRKMASLHE